ncbi:MAG: IS21 family transposase [Myxococcales bacterium]|nr:IS21 family transposase [Myxococcales bacterium]
MGNVLSDDKKQQVLALGRLGWSLRRIETATGIRRETSSRYLREAGIAVRPARGWGHSKPAKEPIPESDAESGPAGSAALELTGPKPAKEAIPDSTAGASRSPRASECEPHRAFIEDALVRGRNAKAIYQDLVVSHGFAARYASVSRFVKKLHGTRELEAHPVIETPPGEEAQVDYGEGSMVRDPATGKYKRTRLFVMTLGYSRKSVRLLSWRSSAQIWSELHERAFRRLGGAPRVTVLDNLKEGVLAPDIYDPAINPLSINPLYRDVLMHYGAVALPCRIRHPDRKGKVESGIGHTQRTALKGLRFESLEDAQGHLDHWAARWADTRIHGTTKRQVAAMFAEEKPHLLALPVEPFRYYRYGKRTVHLDGHVEVDGAYYSAPPGTIGHVLAVQWDDRRVRMLNATGELLREHVPQARGKHRTHEADKPKRTPASTEQLLARARGAGKSVGAVADEVHRRDGELGVRRIVALVGLVKKHGPFAVNDACAFALEVGNATYRFVRQYLEKQRGPQLALKQIDPLIRDLTHYRDLIAQRTQETA